MKRRIFLQLLTLPALPFLRPAPLPNLRTGLVYSDSDGNTPAALEALKDENTATGVVYPA